MNNPLLFFLIPLSFVIALFFDTVIKVKFSKAFVIAVIIICILLIIPFLTDYTYPNIYSNVVVIAIVSTMLNFLWMKYAERKTKLIISITLCILTFIPTSLIFFGRAFVGEPTIYDSQNLRNYRVKYLQESSPGIKDPPKVELYRTKTFGLLQKLVAVAYVGQDSTCNIALTDKANSVAVIYNTCERKIQIK